MRSTSERSVISPVSTQSPATYENSNVVIYEVRLSLNTYYSSIDSSLPIPFFEKYIADVLD